MQTATAYHCVGSTQSHQRRPEDNARVARGACGGLLLPTIDRHPAPRSLCFTRCPSFTRCRLSSMINLPVAYRRQSPWAIFDCQALFERARRALSLRAVRRTKAGAEASLPHVPLPPRVVLRPCAQLQKRLGSVRPLIAALRSLVVAAGFSAVM